MGLFSLVKNVAKARMMGGLVRRGVGGKFGTAMMVAYLGKKAFDAYRGRRARQAGYQPAYAVNTEPPYGEPGLRRGSR